MDSEKSLYTTPQAAQALGISASHMRKMTMTGQAIPDHQIGGTWLFTHEEVERLRTRRRRGKVDKEAPQ